METAEAVGVGLVAAGLLLGAVGWLVSFRSQALRKQGTVWGFVDWNFDAAMNERVFPTLLGIGSFLVLAGFFTAILVAGNTGPAEEGDPCDPGERPPPGFDCR